MTGKYPLILNGIKQGTLTITQKGAKYHFHAFCPGISPLVRLSVYGGNKEGYLGVMQPEEDGLHLRRDLSKSALVNFPTQIEYAGAAGEAPQHKKTTRAEAAQALPSAEDDTFWQPDAMGFLWTIKDGERLCAVPKHFGIAVYGKELEEKNISGTQYRIFIFEKK